MVALDVSHVRVEPSWQAGPGRHTEDSLRVHLRLTKQLGNLPQADAQQWGSH